MTRTTTFVVGRRTRRGITVLILPRTLTPIRGPFTLRALVSRSKQA